MFNYHLPQSIYERLPLLYTVAAILLMLSPLDDLKWLPISALVLAALVTRQVRLQHRGNASSSSLK